MARYKVTREPGAPVEGVGLIYAGHEFVAPPGYIPQTSSFIPMDEEALAAMQKTFPGKTFVLGTSTPAPKNGPEEPLSGTQAAERYANQRPPVAPNKRV